MADAPVGPPAIAAREPGETDTALRLTADSRVELRPLSVRPEGDGFMVGDLARGEFITVPAIAVVVIGALREGRTVAEAAARARDSAGTDVDVADFVETLRDLGFVARIDGASLETEGPSSPMGAGWAPRRRGWRSPCTRRPPGWHTACCSPARWCC